MDYSEKIKKAIANNQVVFLWNRQNIDIYRLYLSKYTNNNVINYSKDDVLLTNYTKLITYFGAGKGLNKFDEKYDYNDLNIKYTGIIKTIVFIIKKIYFSITHRDYTKINNKFSNFQFSNQEINLIAKIKKYSKYNTTNNTIIVNNINFANEVDIVFFKKLIETDFFPKYAPNLKFIFISSQANILNIKLDEINKNNFIEINLSDKELCKSIKNLYKDLSISNEKLIQYLKLCDNDFNLIVSIIKSNQEQSIEKTFDGVFLQLQNIVFEILDTNPQLTVLEIAAVIGLSFDITILNNVSSIEIDDIVNRLNEAYTKGLLTKENQQYNYEFINEFIRNIIYRHGTRQSFWHKKFATEINSISPNEHALISYHYYLGNELKQAIYHYWAYFLSSVIDKNIIVSIEGLLLPIQNAIDNNILLKSNYNYIKIILEKYIQKELEKKELINNFDVQTSSDDSIKQIIKFTKLSILYAGKYTDCEKEFVFLGEELEKSYRFLKENNILGLQIKCGLYLIDIYSYRLNETSKAKKIQYELENITHDLLYNLNTNSILFDNKSLVIKIIRKISMLANAEVAYEKTRNLLEVCEEYRDSLDEVELYKFLSDHIGYALYSGNYYNVNENVIMYSKELLELGENLNFPKQYKLRMNLFLLDLFNNRLSLSDVNTFFKEENKYKNITSSMYKYDMAAISLYCGKYHYSEKILLNLYNELERNNTCFYSYCYNSNLASLYILKKDFAKAKYYNDRILNTEFDWFEDFIRIMKFRASKFAEYIEMKKEFTPKQLYNCFSNVELVSSSAWKFLGKGIIFSELMFYRE